MTPALHYILAFLLICIGAVVRRPRLKQLVLLAAGYTFYTTWGAGFLAILVASSLMNFGFGELLRRRQTLPRLWTGVIANIVLLSFFKYLPPLAGGDGNWIQSIVMPAGMSFWTFQALSYLFDLYQEEELDPTPLEFLLYMSFWPTVLMGPVCRLTKMLPQFREVRSVSLENLNVGLRFIGVGLFMKLIVAQFLGAALGSVEAGTQWGGFDVWVIAIGFGFQLFFDFAGYSSIVLGAARVFGYEIEQNFDAPYLASTPSIFWTKWHMSLSAWIRDYVFVPTATLRRAAWWRYFALAFSMVLFGLWHGATVTFLLWGIYHGVLLVAHRLGQQYQRRLGISMDGPVGSFVSWMLTFFGICLGWVLFRTSDLHEALTMLKAVATPSSYGQFALPADCYRVVLFVVAGYFLYAVTARSKALRAQIERILSLPVEAITPGQRFVRFSLENRWWFVTPMVAMNLIFAAFIVLFQSSRVAPFIYTLF